ncbi:MAG: M14 family metallopeptidase [Candidatus Paceibacterota bacterium]|jgi:hypothetical protein
MKNWIIGILVLVVVGGIGYFLMTNGSKSSEPVNQEQATSTTGAQTATTTTTTAAQENSGQTVIGKSVEGRDIIAYHFGTGPEEILLIGGIHGGYEWNTTYLANTLVDYFPKNSKLIPGNLNITIIPTMNIDGFAKIADGQYLGDAPIFTAASSAQLTEARFNANTVDLNRNFDCNWQASGVWQNKKVSGGSAPFSEPESQAIKNYIEANHPKAVVVYYSAAGGVYSSSCGNGILPETKALTSLYAKASGYKAYDKFDAYQTSGDMVDWLAKINIPAISVLLTNHTDIELDKNLAGVKAVFAKYAK